jgi:hypothetical protein
MTRYGSLEALTPPHLQCGHGLHGNNVIGLSAILSQIIIAIRLLHQSHALSKPECVEYVKSYNYVVM